MNIKVENDRKIEDGAHTGVIVDVQYRTEPFEYTDIVIELEDEQTIKYGVPTKITPSSKLGKLLVEFGANLKVGSELDPNKALVGKRCKFMTLTEKKANGSFPVVVDKSLQKDEEVVQ